MNETEFKQFFAACKPALERFVYFRMPNKVDGDDILQETALAAFQNRHTVKPESFKPWILKIAANKCNDFYRSAARRCEIPLDAIVERVPAMSRFGVTETQLVRDTLEILAEKEKQILFLYYFKNKQQEQIAKQLGIPLGTVKSRLHNAKKHFKAAYPFPPILKGEPEMKQLPGSMPNYTITPSERLPFSVKWEEMMGWFIVPRLGETLSWGMYDYPEKKRSESYHMEVTVPASVHGVDGVELVAQEQRGGEYESNPESRELTRTFVAQLTDTHCRFLSESHFEGGVKRLYTFLDGDEFLKNWGFGEDNCGNQTELRARGTIERNGQSIRCNPSKELLDVVGRYTVAINGKEYDTVCVIDVELYNNGVASEQYVDTNGRTVLWRRFNCDDWRIESYGQRWSEKLPENEQLLINGEVYVHWYDCITDYIL